MTILGPKVQPPAKPPPPEWEQVPDKPHLERNQAGQLRTCNHQPPTGPTR